MGTSLNVSHPPAITVEALPEMIFSAALVMATLEEIHACIYSTIHSVSNVVVNRYCKKRMYISYIIYKAYTKLHKQSYIKT